MTQYLLAAEADKIQDLIFRASRLREVVGGSQLLSRFCKEVPKMILPNSARIIVNDGGSFRVLFNSKNEAVKFGDRLAELYRLALGGSLTVASPVEVNGNFKAAAERANKALRQGKQHRDGFITTPHLPYAAFCVSCGIGLAVEHSARPGERQRKYLCADCRAKRHEGADPGEFLSDFFEKVVGDGWHEYRWPGEGSEKEREDPPMDVARFDARSYIAYLVADGNSMGEAFGECDKEQLESLSQTLRDTIYASLAQPTKLLVERAQEEDQPNFIPVLPLIAGGDDLFVLLPAPWALDFAYRFACAYEEKMRTVLQNLGIQDVAPPTVAIAVIICKAKYPYYLAHQRGEDLLKRAKRITKRWALENQTSPRSIVSFEVVLGNRLTGPEWSGRYRPTLGPYWVGDGGSDGWGIEFKRLVEQRRALQGIPRRRLAQLRTHFDELDDLQNKKDFKAWASGLKKLMERVARNKEEDALQGALEALGGTNLYRVDRSTDRELWYGHALPDLLDAWDFALDLEHPRSEYEE